MKVQLTDIERDAFVEATKVLTPEKIVGMIMEECGEVLSALNKYDRNRISVDSLREEIADVGIMMIQAAILYGEDETMDHVGYKIDRFVNRVKNKSL